MGGKKNQIHVVPNEDGTWANKKPNAKRASSLHQTQAEAIDSARGQAKREGNTEVIIHGRDGKIRNPNTYKRKDDPRKTKG
ncbi:DUF2188 domain-containing protein [Methanobrevibacter millerae]|uniref:DUF2188 domain-containing protein n=1 Tax=Methanobrevibacter millerae TaxID=230361 RepID=A0A1G5WGN5_9EURY|nr:DUF2188 domain-containing protein [Methanobrevibacter millerae]SDA57288.1 hypothetical protein SAMN02910315_01401 [Methanobrevibacter millerae]